ncbi:MAG: HAMP domain-containing sensor histidine kinase [Candidatus Acidiferrales bacterium]
MRIPSRGKTIAFFVVLGVCLVVLAIALNVGWILLNWRQDVLLFFGVIFFLAIILGLILNTTFLVREIRRNEQHDSFINGVTHELKTPIASIRLYLETLQRRDVDEAQRQKFYSLMLLDSDRLLGTVEQVLKAGEAGHQRAPRVRAEVDFEGLVRESVELARQRHHLPAEALRFADGSSGGQGTDDGVATSKDDLAARHDAARPAAGGAIGNGHGPMIVRGDAEELRAAVSNVLDNAIKYSGGTVDVTVRVERPDEKHVALRVSDRGLGIPPEDLKRVFKRFYRVPRRGTKVKGTGLGLYIVRAVARVHGGRVYAESEGEGHGTTVTIELPRSNGR